MWPVIHGIAFETPFAVDLVVAVNILDRVFRRERDRVAVGLDVVDLRRGAAVGGMAAGEADDQVQFGAKTAEPQSMLGRGSFGVGR